MVEGEQTLLLPTDDIFQYERVKKIKNKKFPLKEIIRITSIIMKNKQTQKV